MKRQHRIHMKGICKYLDCKISSGGITKIVGEGLKQTSNENTYTSSLLLASVISIILTLLQTASSSTFHNIEIVCPCHSPLACYRDTWCTQDVNFKVAPNMSCSCSETSPSLRDSIHCETRGTFNDDCKLRIF